MAIELILCRACGSDNVEVLDPAGPGVGPQFACGDCLVIADGCALQDAGAPAECDEVGMAIAIVRKMRAERAQLADASRRIADREQWKGMSW